MTSGVSVSVTQVTRRCLGQYLAPRISQNVDCHHYHYHGYFANNLCFYNGLHYSRAYRTAFCISSTGVEGAMA